MSLKDRITEDMKSAMRAKDSARLSTIRLLLAAIKQREVDERAPVDDPQALVIIEKLIKQRRDSIEQFQRANRQDLVDQERFELSVLAGYQPEQASAGELEAAIAAAIAATGAAGASDMGKVMGVLKPKLAGRADMSAVSAMVKAALAKGCGRRPCGAEGPAGTPGGRCSPAPHGCGFRRSSPPSGCDRLQAKPQANKGGE